MQRMAGQLGWSVALLVVAITGASYPGVPRDVAVTATATILDDPILAVAEPVEPHGPEPIPTFTLRATGYNSLPEQTDDTPHITSTGTTTRFGIVAVSRDLLEGSLPYGSLVRLRDMGTYYGSYSPGFFQHILDAQGLFIVEDTMHARKTSQLDVWFEELSSAVHWGVRRVEVQVVRYGYDGPLLDHIVQQPPFASDATILASMPGD